MAHLLASPLRALPGFETAEPFLKWAGGKRQLLAAYEPYFPHQYGRYFEPFLGSAAVFFRLAPTAATLSDVVDEVVTTYVVVRDDVEGLIVNLGRHVNEREHFARVRALDPHRLPAVEGGARFIYLNRTCYNGLFRVNQRGQFNVPFGYYKNPAICDPWRLRRASEALRDVQILCADFEEAVEPAKAGDFVYLDPPYSPLSQTANFTAYSKYGFGNASQERLASVFRRLDRRGCLLMLSNSDTELVRALYDPYRMIRVKARRAINSRGDRRGPVDELLILNYGPHA
jgi:DNA adenine methylase